MKLVEGDDESIFHVFICLIKSQCIETFNLHKLDHFNTILIILLHSLYINSR